MILIHLELTIANTQVTMVSPLKLNCKDWRRSCWETRSTRSMAFQLTRSFCFADHIKSLLYLMFYIFHIFCILYSLPQKWYCDTVKVWKFSLVQNHLKTLSQLILRHRFRLKSLKGANLQSTSTMLCSAQCSDLVGDIAISELHCFYDWPPSDFLLCFISVERWQSCWLYSNFTVLNYGWHAIF